jgi:hypothetical protein
MAGLKYRWQFWRKRAAQRAARNEVLAEIRQNPVGAYGLYHLLDDAGLLTRAAKRELAPLMAAIAQRLDHGEDVPVSLALPFAPLTDPEHDTLTSLLGQALRGFARALPRLDETQRLARLLGVNDLMARLAPYGAAITHEVRLEDVLLPLLQACGRHLPYYRPDRVCNAQPGDFFRVTRLQKSTQVFPPAFIAERGLEADEILRVEAVWDGGFLQARRLGRTSGYARVWTFGGRPLPKAGPLTVLHQAEGELYRLPERYSGAADRFVGLYEVHRRDRSADPAQYQPDIRDAAAE